MALSTVINDEGGRIPVPHWKHTIITNASSFPGYSGVVLKWKVETVQFLVLFISSKFPVLVLT